MKSFLKAVTEKGVQKAHILLEGILLWACSATIHILNVLGSSRTEPNQTIGRVIAEHHLSA